MCEFKFKEKDTLWSGKLSQSNFHEVENYSKDQINELFELGKFTPVVLYKAKAKKLFDLKLSFDESKYLLQTKGLSVDEIIKCVKEFELKVDLIKKLNCSKETLLTEIPDIILMVGGIKNLGELIDCHLSIEDIKSLLGQLRLTYDETLSLVNCGYKINEIKVLVEAKFRCEQLVSLANIITATEVYSLFQEDKQNLYFLLLVRYICNRQITDLDYASKCYQELYDNIPDNLCKSLINCATKLRTMRSGGGGKPEEFNVSYEEILIYYMDLAGGNIPLITKVFDDIYEPLFEKIRLFNPSYMSFIDEYIPIRPFVLAAIWLALDLSLAGLYFKNAESINVEVVGRTVLAFLISSMCGVTGYFHSGGAGLQFPNITSLMGKCFNVQWLIKQYTPKIYDKIPQWLKFNINETFEKLMVEKQKDAGKGLSMLYTFRVGNAFLCSLLETTIVSSETAKNIFKSLWPLPQETESIRMYFIYSGIPIYTKLNLQGVFVQIS